MGNFSCRIGETRVSWFYANHAKNRVGLESWNIAVATERPVIFASENRRYFISFRGKYARRQNESYIWYIKTSVFPFFIMPLHIFIRVSPFLFPSFSSSFSFFLFLSFFFFFRYSAFEIRSHETPRHSFNHSRIMSTCFLSRKRTDFFRSRFEQYRTSWKP